MSRWQTVVVVGALCLLTGFVGWWIGLSDDPSFNEVDTGFLSDMTTHHQGAIELGFAYLANEHDSLVGHFARETVVTQSEELALMNQLLADAGDPPNAADDVAMDWMGMATGPGAMPGMASDAQFATLRAARGLGADDQFTDLMIRHHAAGIAMADRAAQNGRNPDVRRLAERMAAAQRSEINEMNQRRVALGLTRVEASSMGHAGQH